MTDASNLVVMGTAMCSQICEINLCLTVVNRHSVKWQIVRTTVCCLETAGDVRAQTWKMKCRSVMRIRVISLIFLNQQLISDLFIRESVAERGLQKFTWEFFKDEAVHITEVNYYCCMVFKFTCIVKKRCLLTCISWCITDTA